MPLANTSQRRLQVGWTRTAFTLTRDHSDKLRAAIYWYGMRAKEAVFEVLKLCGSVMDAGLCDSELSGRYKTRTRH